MHKASCFTTETEEATSHFWNNLWTGPWLGCLLLEGISSIPLCPQLTVKIGALQFSWRFHIFIAAEYWGHSQGNSNFHHWNSCHLEFIDISLEKMKEWAYLAWISNEPSFFPATSGRLQSGIAEQGREEEQFLDQQVQSRIVKLPGLQLYRDLQSYRLLRKTDNIMWIQKSRKGSHDYPHGS